MKRLSRLLRVAIAATLFALPALAQTDSVYTDDFQSYGTQKNPPGWVDTSIGSSKPEAGGLYKTWPDPIQGNKGTNVVFGTKQSSGKPEGNNPRIGTFSTYTTKTFAGSGRFEFSGRFIRTNTDSRIGLTFFSSYPEKDVYYLIGLWSQPSTGKLTMQLFGFGGPAPTGTLDSNFTPDPNKWYRFLISADDSNGKTTIHAKFWLDTNTEPKDWNIDAVDTGAGRLTSGRIGMWSAVKGETYIDDLAAKSPVDHTPPVISILESGQPLAEGTRFNRAPSPEIVVTDDLTPAAQIIVTAQLDGQPYVSKTPVTGQGSHTLAVHAVDSVGNASDLTLHFFVDTIPPVVTVVSPKDGSMTANDVTVVLQVADASLPYKAAATLDGNAYNVASPITSEGKHTLALTVTDDVGLSTVVPPITFTIDKSDPVYVLKEGTNAFPNNGFVFNRDVTASVDVTDLTPVTVKLTLDGASYAQGTPITAEGDHTITGTVADSVGHVVTIPPRTFTIDKSAPVVTITENGAPMVTYYDRAVTPVIKVTDFSTYTVSATLNGQPFTFGATLPAEQKYTLAGTVTDAVNHSTPFGPIVFYVDLAPPAVTLTANGNPFPPSTFVFDSDVAAGITIADTTPTNSAITLDGQSITLPLTITTEKAHKLTAVITDSVGKSTTVSVDFVIDKTPPSVDVQESGASLQDGRFFNRKVTPVIVVTDSTQTTVAATLDGQPFTSGTDVTADGAHTIAGTVTDAANHKVNIGPVAFTIDTIKPVGVFKEGDADFPAGQSLNRDVTAHVAVTDASPVTTTVLLDGSPYVENTPITAEQSHTLSATLADKAGNTNTVPPVTFRIDRTPPVVTLLANGSAFPADYIFSKDIAADVRVDDASTTTTKGTLDGNQITFPFTITTEGQHTINAASTDAAGLTTTTPVIHFTLDKTPPSVVVNENGAEAVPNKVWGVDVTVTFTISQGVSNAAAYPTLDGNPYVAGTAITAEGVHTISGEVRSAAGLSTPIPATVFTIDKTKPVVKLLNRDKDFPPSGSWFNTDVVPVVDCSDNLTHCTPKLVLNGTDVPNNTPITAEGAYTLVVSGKDEAGNETVLDPVSFTIDKTPPAVTVTSHTDGQIVTVPEAVIAGATDDAVTVNVNGVAATIDFNSRTYRTPSALPLLEGENIIAVTGVDQAGNPGTKSIRIILDTRNPSLAIKSPAGGACISDADLVVSGSVNDPNIKSVSVTAAGTTIDNALDATKQGFSATFPAIAEGTQNIVVVATDVEGHRTQAQLSVFVDRGVPAIDVLESGVPFTAHTVNRPVALTLKARDLDPGVQLSAMLDGANPYASGNVIGGDGAHRVDVIASDCAGHQATLTIQFTIDTVAPVISGVLPANGSTIGAAPQSITGSVSGDAVRVELEGTNVSAVPAADGDFTLTGATIAEGPNAFTLRATDAAGNVTRVPYNFTVRTQAPKVEIYESGEVLQSGRTFNRPVLLTVHSDDLDATITALLNNATYDGSAIKGDGSYTIEGRATDKLNHTGSATRTFTIDMTPPVVHITSPAPGDVAATVVSVSGTAGDAVSVTVNGIPAQLSNGNFTASNVQLDIGENTITAAATDAAGNTGRDHVLVNVLGTGPGIIITEPADNSLTNRPRIDVAGRVVSPTNDAYVTIGSARAAVDAVGAFRFNSYQLAEGSNTITVSATGKNLQTSSTEVHVTADFTPPALTVLASDQALPDNAQFPQAVTITLRATDNRSAVTTTLSLDGTAQTVPATVSAQGGHVLTATARDTAGNETRIDRTFFIGTSTAGAQGCRIDSTDPADGAVISTSSVTVAGRAPGAVTMTVGGVNATVADGTFTASIDLANEGPNSINVQCAGGDGIPVTRTLTLIRSTGNPSIDITLPAEGFPTGDQTITVSGTVSSDVDTADVNGKPVTITNGTFSVSGIALANGLNTLVAHAHNKAGRTAADSVRVRSIQTAPDVAITSPLSDYQTGDTKVTVSGTWSNLDPATLALSGQAGLAPQIATVKVSDTTGTFTITGAGLAAGLNTLTVTGRNVLNATATSSVRVTVAANTPYLTITSPADNAYLPGDQPINVAGTFGGATAAQVDVNSNPATINAPGFTGSTPFSTAGDVTPVVARLTDGATGNSAYASIRVNRLTAPFSVKEAFPAPGAQEVDTGVIILISFNAPVDMSTIAGAVTLKASDGTAVTGMTLVDEAVLTFAPTSLLVPGTTYTINVATSLKNAAGMALSPAFTSSFTTAATAPATKPSIDPNTSVDCTKPLLITGTATPFARMRMETGTFVLTTNADAAGRFSFTWPFNGQSGYQVARVRIAGADGSLSPAAEVSFRFDCSAPSVVGASYDRNVNTLTISFSKPVDPATLVIGTGGSILLTATDGTTSAGTFTMSGSSVVVTPADDLRTATFTLTVTTAVKDTGANPLIAGYSQTFTAGGTDLPPAPGDGSGFISGEVYDANTGRPLAGANVTIIVPATAFAKAPGTDSRYTIIVGGGAAAGRGADVSSAQRATSSPRSVASNSLHVAVNSTTELRGRYTMPLPEGAHAIQATADGYTTVWRQIIVPAGAGVVPIDIRLAKRGDVKTSDGASAISLASGGDSVITRAVSATIPAGAVPSGSKAALTAVGAQSLAGLLPLGWSPLASAEVAVIDATGAVLPHASLGSNATLTFTLPMSDVTAASQTLSLVQYDEERDEWRVLVPVMSSGSATITNSGAYAVVYHDKASAGLAEPPAAAGGATLQAASGTCAPCELVKKSFNADPNPILPNGRTVATLQISNGSTTKFPSGTAVQAYINEELHLPGGTTLVDPPFATDVLLYRNLAGDTGYGQFHLAPSVQATKVVLSDGVDHIQILQYPGRLDRGTLIGTEGGRVPGDESVAVEIPSSATTVELHASVSSIPQTDLAQYGTIAGFRVLGGFALTMSRAQAPSTQDLDGDGQPDPIPPVVLSRAARATVGIDTTQLPAPSSLVVLAEVVDDTTWGRIIRLADPMTAIDTPQAGVTTVRYTTRSIDPAQLPVDGVVREGKYLILAANDPIAYATGAVRGSAGGVYLAGTRLTSFSQPSNGQLGVADITRNTGVFAIPVAATPASGFALLPKHAAAGEGALINSTSAPAPDTIVKLGDIILTPQSPTLVSTSPANGASIDVSAPLVITMNFSAPIDATSAKSSITVRNIRDNTALTGTINTSGATVTFSPIGALVAGSQYAVTIFPTLRGTNGAALSQQLSFSFLTNAIATNQNIDPLKVHITIPDNGVSRIFGDAGAIPGGWRVVPVRQAVDFITRYQTAVAADGSFSLLIGNGGDASDRISVDDVIDLDVINPAGNIAAVIRLTPFVTPDGKGFIAPAGVDTVFRSVEGIAVNVPAGAFDEPKLITVTAAPDAGAFSAVPNVSTELALVRSINLTFDGVAKKRIELSIPLNGLPADHDYSLGWLGQSVWGPRIAVVDTVRLDGGSLTTSYPPEAAVKKTIAQANSGMHVGTNAGLTDMQIKSCLVGLTRQGSYALMDWTLAVPGGGLGWAVTSGIASEVELMNSNFHSLYLPDFAFSSLDHCAAMPILKGQLFTLTGVDPSTGIVQFKTAYDPIALTDPAVVTVPSPNPDQRGPYPVYGSPFRIETVDFTGRVFYGRGYQLTLQENPPSSNKIVLEVTQSAGQAQSNNDPPPPPLVPLPKGTKLHVYDVTKGNFSGETTVTDDNGNFPTVDVFGDRGDQLVLFITATDIPASATMNVVFSEPIDLGTIPATATDDQKKKLIDDHLKTTMKLERIENNNPIPLTQSATFSVDSQNRRVWVTLPAPLIPGATYRLTALKNVFTDTAGNKLLALKDNNGTPVGTGSQDVPLEFKVRENVHDVLTKFQLQAVPGIDNGNLRDMTQSGNLAFVSALDAGILVYDLSDTDALKKDPNTGANPVPYSMVPARMTPDQDGFEQHWAVTADQHNRIFGAGFTSTFGAVRIYKVEDFVKAHNDSNGSQCVGKLDPSLAADEKTANCTFHGSTVVGWRPGWSVNLPLATDMVMTDYPEAIPRKMQIATQDKTKTYAGIAGLEANPQPPQPPSDVAVGNKTPLDNSDPAKANNFKFDLTIKGTPLAQLTDEEKHGYLLERVTFVDDDLDLRWSIDRYLGEDAVITGVVGRKGDHYRLLRNQMTYDIITMFGYGISIYDMRAVESNDLGTHCGETGPGAFGTVHAALCQQLVPGHPRLLEKILNTRGDGQCNEGVQGGATPINVPPDGIPNVEFSPESLGYTPAAIDPNTGQTTYDAMRLYGLDARRGVLDLSYKLATDANTTANKCPFRSTKGLVFRNPSTGAVTNDRLLDVKAAVDQSPTAMPPRFNAQQLFHWEITAAQNQKGLRGSTPNQPASRDYLLIAGGSYGMLVVEIGGTVPPNGPATYYPLENAHLADVIWFNSGCYAIRVIPKTNLATVLDGKGHVLIVDLSNIDERWVDPNPNFPAAAVMTPESTPFPIAHAAMTATPVNNDEVGVNDARVIYSSGDGANPYTFTTGVIPPLVDPDTGIAFGGDSASRDMRTAELFDPQLQIVADIGKGLEPVTGIVPLGVEPPPHNPNVQPTDPDYAFPAGSLAAFRIRVSLPGAVSRVLDNSKLQFAIESERLPGVATEQTPKGLPAAHLRHNDRDGHTDTRKTDLELVHEVKLDTGLSTADFDKNYRYQSGYNHLLSPWIVAIADPRASERVIWTGAAVIPNNPTDADFANAAAERTKQGCASCIRPKALHGLDEANDKVYELYTSGRYISVRPDSSADDKTPVQAMKETYKYLSDADFHRLETRVSTTMADTVRGPAITVSQQAPPVAGGALAETTYVHSGEVEVNALDLESSGRGGHDVTIGRTHRSRTIGTTVLGSNWEATFLRRLRQLPNGNVEYRDGEGEVWTFTPVKATSNTGGQQQQQQNNAATTLDTQFNTKIKYNSPKGLYLRLARNESGWMLYDQQWRIARFDNYGRLTSESDEFWKKPDSTTQQGQAGQQQPPPVGEAGNTIYYAYDGTGRLFQIYDPVGRKINFEYWPDQTQPNDPAYGCTQPNADRTQPCKFAGRLSKITDTTRNRELLFEYDKLGRLIAVQRPKFKGPDQGPAEANSDTDDRRPRLTYEYEHPSEPQYVEPLQSQTYTDFMELAGNISKIFDASENAPAAQGAPPPNPRPRVRFEYFETAGDVNRDRVKSQFWPCGNDDGTTCTETEAKFQYSATQTKVFDMLGQERDYDIVELTDTNTSPDPQLNRFKHISKITEVDVPVIDKSAPPLTFNENVPVVPAFVTQFNDFDEEGAVKSVTLPNGMNITYTTEAAHNGATGRITTKVSEIRGSDKRYTKYTYENDPNLPNSANTVKKVSRSFDDTNYVDRDTQSANREKKQTQQRDTDPQVKTKVETTFDDYGRVTKQERRADDASFGSGTLAEEQSFTYYDPPQQGGTQQPSDLEKGRVHHVTSGTASGGSSGQQNPPIDIEFTYTAGASGGERVTAHDLNRGTYTNTDYDAEDREIHKQMTSGNDTLAETWTGYDASGRVIYSAHRQSPYNSRVETFITFDSQGRMIKTKSTHNQVNDHDQSLVVNKAFSITNHTITTFDPVIEGTSSPLAKTTTTIDKKGRTESTERANVTPVPGAGTATSTDTRAAKYAYDNTDQLAYTSDTAHIASYIVHDAFGRPTLSFGIDGLRTKTTYDEWNQVATQQTLGTDGTTVLANTLQKFTADGHLRVRNEQIDATGAIRYRQTYSIWEDGGKTTGSRVGKTGAIDALTLSSTFGTADQIRATQQTNDAQGRVTEEIYGSATDSTGAITQMHRRTFTGYQGDAPQTTVDYEPLRTNSPSVTTQVVLDGLDRVRSSTVGGTGGYQTATDYDEAGNVTKITPPGQVGAISRKVDGRGLAYEETHASDTIKNTYDERGTLRIYHDESTVSNDTIYDVDGLGRVKKITYPSEANGVAQTTEEFVYEDKTGLLKAHKDRKDVWLNYSYDEGGRTTEIKTGDPNGIQTTVALFEYDPISKRLTRAANKDAAIEYSSYDDLGRAGKTVTYRYAGGSGLNATPQLRQVLDVHAQTHSWSVFGSERSSWRMPVTGPDASASNGSAWLTTISESHDASTNLTVQTAGGTTINGTPAGIGHLAKRSRVIGSQSIDSTYSYTDQPIPSPAVGIPQQPQSGLLRQVETTVGGATVAGSEVFRDDSMRIGALNDLAFATRQSRWTYDPRGRVKTTKLLAPLQTLNFATPVTDTHNETTFRSDRETAGLLSAADHGNLGVKLSLQVEPPKWHAADSPSHEIKWKSLYLDNTELGPTLELPVPPTEPPPTMPFQWEGGRRTSDGTWKSSFDEFGRLMSIESDDRHIDYTYDPRGRIVGRSAKMKNTATTPVWVTETRASVLVGDGLPAETTWVWDPIVDRLIAMYETGKSVPQQGSTTQPAADAGLVRQYLHGDRGYDDPVEVLIAPQSGATPAKYFPIFDEAGTGSLQAVLDKDGNVVERVLYGDSYGDAPRYLQGPVAESITYATDNSGAVDIRVHTGEKVKQLTVANGVRLVSLKADGSVAATAPDATLDADNVTVHWHLAPGDWSNLINAPGATTIEIDVTSSLRTYAWGDVPFGPVPDFAHTLYGATFVAANPIVIRNTIASFASLPSNGDESPLYEVKSPYMAGLDYSKTKLLVGFHALPFNEPASSLIFARARWYDPSTGSFLTPDPIGYHDASSLYAFAGGDPVNGRDPLGMADQSKKDDLPELIPAHKKPDPAKLHALLQVLDHSKAVMPAPRIIVRRAAPSDGNPLKEGFKPTDPNANLRPYDHVANKSSAKPASQYISGSDDVRGIGTPPNDVGTPREGTRYVIDADKYKKSGGEIVENAQIEADYQNAVDDGLIAQQRMDAWKDAQTREVPPGPTATTHEYEVLMKGEVPAGAVSGYKWGRIKAGAPRVLTYVAVATTAFDLGEAAARSHQEHSWAPFGREVALQAGSWGGGTVGCLALSEIPGGCLVGGIAGGNVGREMAQRMLDAPPPRTPHPDGMPCHECHYGTPQQ